MENRYLVLVFISIIISIIFLGYIYITNRRQRRDRSPTFNRQDCVCWLTNWDAPSIFPLFSLYFVGNWRVFQEKKRWLQPFKWMGWGAVGIVCFSGVVCPCWSSFPCKTDCANRYSFLSWPRGHRWSCRNPVLRRGTLLTLLFCIRDKASPCSACWPEKCLQTPAVLSVMSVLLPLPPA